MPLKPNPFQITFIALIFCCCTLSTRAQHADSVTYKPNKIYFWAGLHFGGGSFIINGGADAGLLFNNRFVIAARADGNSNIHIFAPPSQTKEADEYAFMLGLKLTHRRYSNLYLLSGISAITQKDRGDYLYTQHGFFSWDEYGDDKVYHSVGVPIQITYMLPPTSFFAMDFSGAVNVNPHRTFFSLTFGIKFGHVRSGAPKAPPGGTNERPMLPLSRPRFGRH